LNQFYDTGLSGEQYIPYEALAALIIVHGLGEHRGRYRAVVEHLKTLGIARFTYDQRGHGESPGARAHISKFSEFTDDLSRVIDAVQLNHPVRPVFLWGHSLGAIIVLRYVLRFPGDIQGGITTGCPIARLPKVVDVFSKAGSRLFGLLPKIRMDSRLDPVQLSHDVRVQTAYDTDPLVSDTVTLKLVFEMSRAIKRIKKHAHEIRIPWLAIHGSEDVIAPPQGSRMLINALGSSDKQLEMFEGSRHEVQNETSEVREKFLKLISEWIRERS